MNKLYRILRPVYARAYIRIFGGFRERSWIFWEVILPTIFMSSIIFAYQNLGAPKIFIGFVVIGTVIMNFWYNVLWGMGSVLYWEKETGNLEIYLLSGAPIPSLLLGMALGGMFNTTIRSISMILIGTVIFKAEFNLISLPYTIVIFILTLTSLYSLGIALSSLHLIYGRKGVRMNEVLGEPISFLSGQYYPLNIFPSILQSIASLLPITIGLDGIRRSLILGLGIDGLYIHILILILMSMTLFPLGIYIMNKIVEKGKRDGRLILRWI